MCKHSGSLTTYYVWTSHVSWIKPELGHKVGGTVVSCHTYYQYREGGAINSVLKYFPYSGELFIKYCKFFNVTSGPARFSL
jgi:hypothetical protein